MFLRNRRKIGRDDVSKQPVLCWELRSKRRTTGGVKLDDLTFFFFLALKDMGHHRRFWNKKKDLI